ncbi:BTB/POZ domain-containing protein 3-like [Contarinia nasturtii]|uniref:BTB/POZ domain-containing protein 3-like n=1 Tax=Contarinia nasturtii TaxID=265458 RepID=UPI0012D4A690|nr:BTB/POZ domain-containing protein 3-like [Contarinia nasturtii]XP_031635380.1 BTB/POZ domain-containing protein 3-like [Contarinia nasturtii]
MESPSTKRKRFESGVVIEDQVATASKSGFASKIFRRQYLDEKTADVYFICGPTEERVPAHKSVLSKASDPFDRMFYGPMAETGDVKLPHTNPDAFRDFLQFFYLDEVNLNMDYIVDIMDLTNKYCMPECLVVCGSFWAKHLTFDDICCAYYWAIFYQEPEFIEFCERKISAYSQLVFKSNGFLHCDYIVLSHILELDSLLCDETIVFEACMDWAQNACVRDGLNPNDTTNLRIKLKDSLYKIRYCSMTVKEFREHMDTYNDLFTDVKEYEDIIRMLSGSKNLKTGRFNPNPRSTNIFQWDDSRVFKCKLINNNNSSVFSSNKPLLLGGFYCAPISEATNWRHTQVDMTITEEPKTENSEKICPKIIVSKQIKLDAKEETYVEFADTGTPIIIRPEFKYRINFKPITTGLPFLIINRIREIKLDDETIMQFPQEDNDEDRAIIKRFNFNRL